MHIVFDAENCYEHITVKIVALEHKVPQAQIAAANNTRKGGNYVSGLLHPVYSDLMTLNMCHMLRSAQGRGSHSAEGANLHHLL